MANSGVPSSVWERLSNISWPRVLPGMAVMGLVVLARVLGFLEGLELKTLDDFLRLRPAEPRDKRLLIVGINEADIQRVGTYPIPDQDLAALIQTLLKQSPSAVGIDIYRDLPVGPGHETLAGILETSPQVFGIEKISAEDTVFPPPALPPERTGFVDFVLDSDGFVRRAYLGALPPGEASEPDRFRFSFALKLAEAYLAQEDLVLESGLQNPENMRFGIAELFRLQPNSGSYVGVEAAGVQMLINPRSGKQPFEVVSMTDVLTGQVSPDLIRDRVIMIGIMTLSVKDFVNSAAVANNPGRFYGVEMQAHITSQILSATLDNRPLLRVWGDGWEYGWIVLWSSLGMLLVYYVPRPSWYVLSVGIMGLGLVGISLGFLWLAGWWIPVVPPLIGFVINGCVLPGFYFYDQILRSRIEERQRVIEETYDAIHNGPLQSLALLLREKEALEPQISTRLEHLNRELREVYERLLQESRPQGELLQLGTQCVISLDMPLHQALYKVYAETLMRDFPGFSSIQFQVVEFETLQTEGLSYDDKRSLCRFLEEAICNVGKHAIAVKRLTVVCLATETENLIRVEDDGKASEAGAAMSNSLTERHHKGRGTQQALVLARRLRGVFQRSSDKTGTCCELRWPVKVRHPHRTAQ